MSGLVALAASNTQAATVPFCQRLADQLGMKQVRQTGRPDQWKLQLLSPAQRWLMGGTAMVGLRIHSTEGISADGSASGRSACSMERKEYACNVVGPASLLVTLKNREVTQAAEAGEVALVGMSGTSLSCQAGLVAPRK